MTATARKKSRKTDPFRDLLDSRESLLGQYRPMVGYLHADGTVTKYSTEMMGWYDFDRAVSSCFGSAARRFRGLKSFDAPNSPIVAVLMMVLGANGEVKWKQRIDVPVSV